MFDETLLHWETLTRLVNDFKPQGVPLVESGMFPKGNIEGKQAIIDIIKVNRTKAHSVGHRSPSVSVAPEVIKRQPIMLARAYEHVKLDGSMLMNLRNPGAFQLQKIAADQVAREVKKLGRRIDYRNEFYMASAIQGSLTDTIDGVSFTASYNFPASHVLTVGGGELDAAVLTTAWSDPDADILGDITAICQAALEDGGFEVTRAVASPETISDIIKNNQVNTYFRSTPEGTQFLKTRQLGEFAGLKWMKYGNSYRDDAGDVQRFLPRGVVCFMPDPDPLVAELLTGDDSIPTPNKMDMQSIQGRYSYASIIDDPVAIKLFAGEVSLPAIYVPSAFFKATVS